MFSSGRRSVMDSSTGTVAAVGGEQRITEHRSAKHSHNGRMKM